jgi:hypothetical protein
MAQQTQGKGRAVTTYRDGSVKVTTREALERWVRRAGWTTAAQFEKECGVTVDELVGQRFTIVANRCFIGGA